ncbi:MAG: very short patch repair endonuclease [Muribaculaceae bacterium]|nr:very short patch repair endonuclease [Muribaculaceae bacterium]
MADTMTPEQRSRCMAAIKGKNTKPEIMVRKFLFAKGLRYRINNRKLPGTPDIVFKKYRTVVFVDGCFWHGHEGCPYYKLPKTNTEYWEYKIRHNKARDISDTTVLQLMGWKVIRIWECQIRGKDQREKTLEKLYFDIIGKPSIPKPFEDIPEIPSIAAEPETGYGE